ACSDDEKHGECDFCHSEAAANALRNGNGCAAAAGAKCSRGGTTRRLKRGSEAGEKARDNCKSSREEQDAPVHVGISKARGIGWKNTFENRDALKGKKKSK